MCSRLNQKETDKHQDHVSSVLTSAGFRIDFKIKMTLKAPHDYFIQFLLNLSFLDCQISYQTYRQSDASPHSFPKPLSCPEQHLDGHRGLWPTKVGHSMISYFICLTQQFLHFAMEDKLVPAIQSLQVFLKSCRFVAV